MKNNAPIIELTTKEIGNVAGGIARKTLIPILAIGANFAINTSKTIFGGTCAKFQGWGEWSTCWALNVVLPSLTPAISPAAEYFGLGEAPKIDSTTTLGTPPGSPADFCKKNN